MSHYYRNNVIPGAQKTMIRAQHVKLTQDSNQRLLDIRQNEINYYSNFLITFSTLAALCASLIVNTVTQVQAYSTVGLLRGLKTWFWLSCTVTICLGIHCVVVSSVTLVYGLGLALKGPLGSMIRAIKGMVRASKIVYVTFVVTMGGFMVVNMSTFWMVAFSEIALVSTGIFVVFMIGIAYHCVEITERFYWKELDGVGTEVDNDLIGRLSQVGDRTRDSANIPTPSMARGNKRGMLNSTGRRDRNLQDLDAPLMEHDHATVVVETCAGDEDYVDDYGTLHLDEDADVYYEGSLSVKESHHSGTLLSFGTRGPVWERYFFVLTTHYLWYYRDKDAYDRAPEEPVKTRPIDISDFDAVPVKGVKLHFNLEAKPDAQDAQANAGEGILSGKGTLKLKNWEFKADTYGEFAEWLRILAIAVEKKKQNR